ncbi:hypothetical protein DFJ74DRAFT_708449 [Hyaloraphidium curvatum]|nr:hypothetical protein DFJ74DRAFT_708449 [Hyaloraphidium curvatum]
MPVFSDPASRRVDLALLLFFTLSLALSVVSAAVPRWLVAEPSQPYLPATLFGLFRSCAAFGDDVTCTNFPSARLCEERGDFCAAWLSARFGVVLACAGGAVAAVGGVLGLAAEEGMKAMAGKMAVAGVLVHLLGQVVAMSVMINVEANADGAVPLPVFRTAFGASFVLCIVSWVADVFIVAIKLVAIGLSKRSAYTEIAS